jgi:hypothetical protein
MFQSKHNHLHRHTLVSVSWTHTCEATYTLIWTTTENRHKYITSCKLVCF